MRSTIITALIIAILVPLFASAQATVGCCCDPVAKTGNFMTAADCAALSFTFVGPPPNIAVTCNQHCGAVLAPGPAAICGDGICQASESQTSCAQDCAIVVGCGSPTYRPAPTSVAVSPVRGHKSLKLTFTLPCPVDYLNISRCKGADCTNLQKIAEIPSATQFIDEDARLEFNVDYTYSIVAHYTLSGDSEPALAIGNAGDIECWQHGEEAFCINYFSYDQFKEYLTTFGYVQSAATDFTTTFGRTVNLTFATRLNHAWQCNEQNKLTDLSPSVSCDARQNEYCIADETGPRCAKRQPCGGFNPFGLFATQQTCESFARYCFFDKSKTTANACYSCDPKMGCYDYKSKKACESENCGAGDCQWKSVFEDVGTGVCIDKRSNNCKLCDKLGTPGMENLNASSTIWDACREEKSNALSNALYPCFFDKDKKISKTCDEVSCSDYTQLQCGSPEAGIQLNTDNSLETESTDVCRVKVCEYHLITGCVKNADGNTGAGFQDCAFGNKTCEQDYFPPITTLIPTGMAGRIDFIYIRVFDKINRTSAPADFAGKPGYKTYLCIKNETSTCTDARAFPIAVNATQLILKNGLLKQGNKTISKLKIGNNTIVHYSRDAANNLEILDETIVYACDKCNGPKLLNISVTGGRVIGNKIYTSATKPTFTFTFDEPTQITFAEITREAEFTQLSRVTTGMAEKHQFTPTIALLGTYNFTINGHNDKTIYMDPPGLQYVLIVDPELAGVNITPADGSSINKTSIDIELNFSRPVTLTNISLVAESFEDPYVITEKSQDITKLFKTTNNQTYTAKVDKLTGGKNTIIVIAEGFNALQIYKQNSFFVATTKPGIRLVTPAFGVSAYSVYNASIETPLPAQCAYVYDTPSAPSITDFKFFKQFDGLGTLHNTSGLGISYGDTKEHQLHTYCEFEDFGIIQRSFNITLDPEPPEIVKAFAEPNIIAEQFIPDKELYVTTLKIQLDKPGFCKYSLTASNFATMEGLFPGYDKTPKQSLGADVNVTEKKSYEYYVACKGKNQLTTPPEKVPFKVDLSLPLTVTSSTPQGFGTLEFTIGVVANKRVICYFGEQEDDATRCMGACTSGYTQSQNITVQSQGQYTYYVKCAHFSGAQSDVIEIPVIIDTTPPAMEYVKDESVLNDTELTWSQNRIRVAFKANDPESNISHYLITLRDQTANKVEFKDYVSNVTSGEYTYIKTKPNGAPFRLVNGNKYSFSVKAVNRVGLESDVMESDGVTVDISQEPEPCLDGERNEDETDTDCGGNCDGCPENGQCLTDKDCATNYCAGKICKIASCEDGVMNGLESDVDCGGQACDKCENDRTCIQHSDCATDYCDVQEKICTDAPPCADKVLTPQGGETDIDCGGPCEKCGNDKNCQESTDCDIGLNCHPDTKKCTTEPIGDEDHDSITDDKDECSGTPPTETADEKGCGPSQTYSLGDEINDQWRQENFGCIDCPEAAADADPDKDGLTNLEEFKTGTNPTNKDTDGDGWNDKKEIEKGTDPTDPASHPPSILLGLLKTLLVLILIAGFGYGIYIIMQARKEKKVPIAVRPERPTEKPAIITAEQEIKKLRTFAKEEELPEKEWVTLEKEIKKKPLPPEKFREALERLKKIARKEARPEEPLQRLRTILEELGGEERAELLEKYQLLRAGLLSPEEREALFKKLKITAEYYRMHKEELERELETYGKRKRKR